MNSQETLPAISRLEALLKRILKLNLHYRKLYQENDLRLEMIASLGNSILSIFFFLRMKNSTLDQREWWHIGFNSLHEKAIINLNRMVRLTSIVHILGQEEWLLRRLTYQLTNKKVRGIEKICDTLLNTKNLDMEEYGSLLILTLCYRNLIHTNGIYLDGNYKDKDRVVVWKGISYKFIYGKEVSLSVDSWLELIVDHVDFLENLLLNQKVQQPLAILNTY